MNNKIPFYVHEFNKETGDLLIDFIKKEDFNSFKNEFGVFVDDDECPSMISVHGLKNVQREIKVGDILEFNGHRFLSVMKNGNTKFGDGSYPSKIFVQYFEEK